MTLRKIPVDHICVLVIPHDIADPGRVFLEFKDGGYPWPRFRNHRCIIGGNRMDAEARADISPLATISRELKEELSISPEMHNRQPLRRAPTPKEHQEFEDLVLTMDTRIRSWMAFHLLIPQAVFDEVPGNTQGEISVLYVYHTCPLQTEDYNRLLWFHEQFGNISVESHSSPQTAARTVVSRQPLAWGHGLALAEFFKQFGHGALDEAANNMPQIPGIQILRRQPPLPTYAHYLELYDVARQPPA